jgi:hypothetical protein
MTRLLSELHRLYLPMPQDSSLIDAHGQVKAMVLALARPADWDAIAAVWRGVQTDLNLPAPAIAVDGVDAYQLWFSLAEPCPAPQAMSFLESLRLRYLRDIAPERVGMMPTVDVSGPQPLRHARRVPAQQGASDHWSSFVAPDLAPVFADTPWLDIPPSSEGQADLLSRLDSIGQADFQRALEMLAPAAVQPEAQSASGPVGAARTCQDPRQFLLDVMNNESVALGLRIDAAKALLPYASDPPAK